MEKIASFQINHDLLEKGMYVSRIDGDVVTYDIRMKKPNGGDYLEMSAAHTLEHLLATHLRNSAFGKEIVYVGPMGCRTGFYILTRDSVSKENAISLIKDAFEFAAAFEGEIPGSKKEECGNYLDHDLVGAKKIAREMYETLSGWTIADLQYKN